MSGKMPCEEMGTGVGPRPGAERQASPAGSEQCRKQQKEATLPRAVPSPHSGNRRQITATSLGKRQRVSSGACWGWVPAILPTARRFPLHPHLCLPSSSAHARHGDASPTCLKAVLKLDEAEGEIHAPKRQHGKSEGLLPTTSTCEHAYTRSKASRELPLHVSHTPRRDGHWR